MGAGSETADPGDSAAHVLVLEAASWREVPAPEGLRFVIVRDGSPTELIAENLTANAQGFDPTAAPVDAEAAEAFRPSLDDAVAITARWQDVAVAAGMARMTGEGRAELVGITTLERYRRLGIGAALTSQLVELALAAGASTVFLTTDDQTALRIYRRLGFHEA